MTPTWSLRHVTDVQLDKKGATFAIDALPVVQLGGAPGWLTGEPPRAQGFEVDMPNLPRDLHLPTVEPRPFMCRITAIGKDAVRVVIAPAGDRILDEPLTWLGIAIADGGGPTGWVVQRTADELVLVREDTRVHVGLSPFTLHVTSSRGTVLRTAERLRQVAGFPMAPPVLASNGSISLSLELATDEDILGFGEQFSRLVKNGQQLRLRTEDALGTGTGMAYKPVPVWHSSAGYLGFLNTGAEIVADVGHTRPSVLSVSLATSALDLVVVIDEDPAARLATYTALTGRPDVPPLWAFGYWMGRCRYHSSQEMLEIADTMRAHRVPCDVLHCDPDWLILDRLNTDFLWNEERFGPLADFVRHLADRKIRLSVWEVPYLDPRSPAYQEAEENGYLVHAGDGHTLTFLRGTPTPDGLPRGLVDFTNAEAKRWWQAKHEAFIDAGVAVFKTDFGEGCPDDVATQDGTPGEFAHNLYPLRYNGAVSDAIRRYTGRNPLVWGRSAWAGSQRYAGQWGGDAESTVVGMQATVRGGLSYAMSAPGFWSHDIGGFFGPELTPGLYVRWTQLGALSPLMRAHGLRPREPWQFGDDALEICRNWIRLRYSLLPYLWQAAHDCAERGLPMMRPLALEFPADPVCAGLDSEFLLGRDLLVVPIFDDGLEPITRRFYLPPGTWTDLLTQQRFTGPGYVEQTVALDRMPLLVREGGVIPMVDVDDDVEATDDLLGRPWTVHVWGPPQSGSLVAFDGEPLGTVADLAGRVRVVKH